MRMSDRQGERGAVALLTTIIISILLTIITVGLVSLMISELRQSNDSEQSVRAYFAAQSGVEDGISKVIASMAVSPKVPQTCGMVGSSNTDLDPANPGVVGWTCQQISYSGQPTGSLPVPDKAVQIDLGNTNFGSVVMEWDLTPPPYAGGFFNATGNLPTAGGWNHPAAMELGIVDYPSGTFNAATPGAINITNALVVPRLAGGFTYSLAAIKGNNPLIGRCNAAAGSYHCRVDITNFNGGARNYILRLRSRYVGSDYRLTFHAGASTASAVVDVPDGTATIDITAKAGDVYRRVIYKVPYENGAATGLDYVIFADKDVCKDMSIFNGAVQSQACP